MVRVTIGRPRRGMADREIRRAGPGDIERLFRPPQESVPWRAEVSNVATEVRYHRDGRKWDAIWIVIAVVLLVLLAFIAASVIRENVGDPGGLIR